MNDVTPGSVPESKRVLAGVLGILLGGLGIHKFVLGYTLEGVLMIVGTIGISVVTCGLGSWAVPLVGLIEGIVYLTKSDAEFIQTYQLNKRGWF